MPIKTLKFFKESRFSPLVRIIRYAILGMYGDRDAERIARALYNETERDVKHKAVRLIRNFFLARLKQQEWSSRVHPYLTNYHKSELPFQDYDCDPAEISQVKKIVNALYYAEVVLLVVEGMDVDHLAEFSWENSVFKTINQVPIGDTIEQVYELCRLITHPDVDLFETFTPEWRIIVPFLSELATSFFSFSKDANAFLLGHQIDLLNPTGLSNQLGTLYGAGIHQLASKNGRVDYHFLTQFGVELPHYLEKLTQYLQQFSSEPPKGLVINESKYHELEGDALMLLYSLERISVKGIFNSRALFDVMDVLRHGHTLIWNILNEVSHFSSTSQDTIKVYLSKLKKNYCAKLIACLYKIEEESTLNPGHFSRPVLNKLTDLYNQIIAIANPMIDFSCYGRDLVTLQDMIFISKSLEPTYQRRAEREYKQLMLTHAIVSSNAFFTLLKAQEEQAIAQIDTKIKSQLIIYYHAMQPIVALYRAELNRFCIQVLSKNPDSVEKEHDWMSALQGYFTEMFVGKSNQRSDFEKVIALEPVFNNFFKKVRKTLQFKQLLSDDLIHYVYESSDRLALEMTPSNSSDLSFPSEQVCEAYRKYCQQPLTMLDIALHYQSCVSHQHRLMKSKIAFQDFLIKLKQYSSDDAIYTLSDRRKLRNLYGVFQPMLSSPEWLSLNAGLVNALSGMSQGHPMHVAEFYVHEHSIARAFKRKENDLQDIISQLKNKHSQLLFKQHQTKILSLDKDAQYRANFLVRKPQYAALVAQMRQSTQLFFEVFQPIIQERLAVRAEGVLDEVKHALTFSFNKLPYPEISDPVAALCEPHQVLWLKRLANMMSHFEQASEQIELLNDFQEEDTGFFSKMNNQRLKAVYVARAVKIEHHIREGIWLIMDCFDDPYLSVLCNDLVQQIKTGFYHLRTVSAPYLQRAEYDGTYTKSYDVIYYLVNAIMLMPKQIEAALDAKQLNAIDLEKIRERARLMSEDAYRVIESTHSYFKLFLETPRIIQLFLKLKENINILSKTTNSLVAQHIQNINHDIFASMLQEGDLWEAKLLKSGLFTKPLKQLLDTFYQGFLDSFTLSGHDYIALRSSIKTYESRIKTIDKRVRAAEWNIKKVLEKKKIVETFLSIFKSINQRSPDLLLTGGLVKDDEFEKAMIQSYIHSVHAILPLLQEAKPRCLFAYWQMCEVAEMEELFASKISMNTLNSIDHRVLKKLVDVYVSYTDGLLNSQKMAIETHVIQKKYIEDQKNNQKKMNQTIVEDYIKSTLKVDKYLRPHLGIHKKLIHVDGVYDKDLMIYVQQKTPEIVKEVDPKQDIDLQIKRILAKKVHLFEEKNLTSYQQLETVQAAIDKLNHYLLIQSKQLKKHATTWAFETVHTIKSKKDVSSKLTDIIAQHDTPIEDRLSKLAFEIKHPRFKNTLLAHHRYDSYSFGWIIQCVMNFLEFVHLYTPERKKVYELLRQSVEKPRSRGECSFSSTTRSFFHSDKSTLYPTNSKTKLQLGEPLLSM